MAYHHRTLEKRLPEISSSFPALLVTGPRQSGKTTLLRRVSDRGRRYVTLDDPALRDLARQDPRLFLQRFPPPVLIDEIQYGPELLPHIKMAIDARRAPGQFWLTGSQQFQMMKGITETLAGRIAILNLLGFSRRERRRWRQDTPPFLPLAERVDERGSIRPALDLHDVFHEIWLGSFPALAEDAHREVFMSSYLQTYLERDVRSLTNVGDLAAFQRFIRACAARTGQLLNLSELARDVDVSVPTAKRWLSVLEASFQVLLLRPFHSNVTKRLIKTPKLYFLDTGLCSYLTGWTTARTLADGAMSGAIFESHVVGEILRSWWHDARMPAVHFYRDRDGKEIDLLFEVDGSLHAVEIKRAATVRREWRSTFRILDRLGIPVGSQAVVCLTPEAVPLDEHTVALPVGSL
jgi:predicted AAA+ superfamily ATPase